jgi:hypothetical protein
MRAKDINTVLEKPRSSSLGKADASIGWRTTVQHLASGRMKLMQFLAVDQVDLKWLFDHFRNYGIAGALMFASQHVLDKPSASVIPHFNQFASVTFFMLSALLFLLNFIHGGIAYKKQFGSQRLWTYALLAITWFMLMEELMQTRVDGIGVPVVAVTEMRPHAGRAHPSLQVATVNQGR